MTQAAVQRGSMSSRAVCFSCWLLDRQEMPEANQRGSGGLREFSASFVSTSAPVVE